jgi:glycine/serine hydroxymethyltransferase
MGEPEMEQIGRIIGSVLRAPDDESGKAHARSEVRELMDRFPPYGG